MLYKSQFWLGNSDIPSLLLAAALLKVPALSVLALPHHLLWSPRHRDLCRNLWVQWNTWGLTNKYSKGDDVVYICFSSKYIYIYTYEHETNTVVTSSDPQENQQFLGGCYSYITWICLRTPQKMKHILPKSSGFPVRSGKSSSANPW